MDLMRSPHKSGDEPIETHTSVYRKSHPRTADAASSVKVMLARVSLATACTCFIRVSPGQQDLGPLRRISMPILAAPISRELATLELTSPRKQNEISSRGLWACSPIVRKSARIWVGCASF